MINPNSYNGNANIKKDGVEQSFSKFEIEEYIRCSEDPIYFIKNYCKIISLDLGLTLFKLYPYQEDMIKHYHDNRFSVTLSPRQIGKCQHINTIVTVRNKASGKIEKITVGELYERSKRKMFTNQSGDKQI